MSGALALGAIAAAAGWLALALALPAVPARWRAQSFWVAVAAAVPLLGWLTYAWGPGLGVAGFVAGLLALRRCPRRDSVVPNRAASLPPAE